MSRTLPDPAATPSEAAAPMPRDVVHAPQPLVELATEGRVSRIWLVAAAALVTLGYALLWSPWWYPLSDSSLYLIMARNLANGQGLSSLAAVHKSVRPMTPIVLSLVLRAGGDIGAMHVVMIAFMLLAHALCFLTMRWWFNERIALVTTLGCAASWWCGFSNAFTIMTEPLFLVMWWGSMASLGGITRTQTTGTKWAWALLCILLMVGAWYNRVAALLLSPGVMVGMVMGLRRYASLRDRLAWALLLAVVMGAVFWVYWRKAEIKGAESGSTIADVGEAKISKVERYKWNVLIGMDNPLIQLPITGGRWVAESLAAVFIYPHTAKSGAVRLVGNLLFVIVFLITVLGGVRLLWRERWWMLTAAIYFFPFWYGWGTRVKPRYMAPVLPLILVALWEGLSWAIVRIRKATARSMAPASGAQREFPQIGVRRAVAFSGICLFAGGVLLNIPMWGLDLYVRHAPGANFYDLARRGAYAELVDIGAYLQAHARPDDAVWENRGGARRVVTFLADHAPETVGPEIPVKNSADADQLNEFFKHARRGGGRYALVFFDTPAWPNFHWPLPTQEERQRRPRWWQLYERTPSGDFKPVDVPTSRDYVRDIPGLKR